MAHEWTDSLIDELLLQMDPSADAVAAAVLESGRLDAINALMRTLTHNLEPVPEELPEPVRAYFEDTDDLPEWAEPAKIEAGETLFVRYGVPAMQSLLYRSLPECYAGADGADVLHRTGRLDVLTRQRVLETVHFTVDVMSPGGLGPEGRGVRSAQRVRLLHAAIRTHLLEGDNWALPNRSPINQLEMIGTLGGFSILVLDTMRRFGVDLSKDECDAYIHCWNVVGYIMGVREDLLFHDLEDGLALWERIREVEHRPSVAGEELTGALLAFANGLVPGRLFDGINATMLRFACGNAVADTLGVPPANWTRIFLGRYRRLVSVADGLQDLGPLSARVAAWFGHRLIRGLLGLPRVGTRPSFDLPDQLRNDWKMPARQPS